MALSKHEELGSCGSPTGIIDSDTSKIIDHNISTALVFFPVFQEYNHDVACPGDAQLLYYTHLMSILLEAC
jgi:hypothetical protein